MSVFPTEIYEQIILFAFALSGPSTPFTAPTPRRNALSLPLVSRAFYELAQPALFHSITIASSVAWTTLFGPSHGLLVSGPWAAGRLTAVRELVLDLGALPPGVVRWRTTTKQGFGSPELTLDPMVLPLLPNVDRLVLHTPWSWLKPRLGPSKRDTLSGSWLEPVLAKGSAMSPAENAAIALAAFEPFAQLVGKLPTLQLIDSVFNDRALDPDLNSSDPRPKLGHLLRLSPPSSIVILRAFPRNHPRFHRATKLIMYHWAEPCLGNDRSVEVQLGSLYEREHLAREIDSLEKREDVLLAHNWFWRTVEPGGEGGAHLLDCDGKQSCEFDTSAVDRRSCRLLRKRLGQDYLNSHPSIT